MTNLASTYQSQGRWDEAEKLQMEVMNTWKVKLGSGPLTTMNNLALSYQNQGRWDEAEKLQVKLITSTDSPCHEQFGIKLPESGKVG